MKPFLRPDWIGWLVSAAGAVLLAVAANVFILVARPFGATEGIPIDRTGPIGALIGLIVPCVWLFLFAAMGTAFWLVGRKERKLGGTGLPIIILILLCTLYPVYTIGLNRPVIALAGNAAVLATCGLATWRARTVSRPAALLLLPVIAWVSLASVALIALIAGARF